MRLRETTSWLKLAKFGSKISATLAIAALAGLVFSGSRVPAQVAGTGTIQGTITDSTGAVVPGATVKATQPATGASVTQTTSSSGVYVIGALVPGTYTIQVTKAGFETLVQNNLVVNALTVVGLDLVLKAGAATQTVEVNAAPPEINTQNGSLDYTIPNSTYSELPVAMNGTIKSPVAFVTLEPGAVNSGYFGGYNLNTSVGNTASIYMDGLAVQASELQGDFRIFEGNTPTEQVDQFQVVTGGVPAYYDGQGIVNLVIKSGTNAFHGSVYENLRNTKFDSAYYGQTTPAVEHQNEFGGSAGGPIWRNHAFFFGNYDGYRTTAASAPTAYTIPTTAMQTGDFSALLPSQATPTVGDPIYDPATTGPCPGNAADTCRQQFQYNGVYNVIPPARLSSISQSFQSYLPTGNGNPTNNIVNQFSNGSYIDNYMAKGDVDLTPTNRAAILFQLTRDGPIGTSGLSGLPVPYNGGRIALGQTYNNQITDTQQIGSHMVNLFGFGFFMDPSFVTIPSVNGQNYPVKAGLTGLPSGVPSEAFPPLVWEGGADTPSDWGGVGGTDQAFNETSEFELYQDNLEWTHGRHSLTFGGAITAQQEKVALPNVINDIFFNNLETGYYDSTSGSTTIPGATTVTNPSGASGGAPYASYLLGLVDSDSASDTAIYETSARYKNFSFYAQDDWKLTPKFTLNLGLRYTIPKPFIEAHNQQSWFDPTLANPAVDGYPGALQFAGNGADSCHCRTNVDTHYLTFGPRVGFADQIRNGTVVRGSFSIVHFNGGALGGVGLNFDVSQTGFATNPSFTSPNGSISPAFNWNNGFPAYPLPPIFNSTVGTGYYTGGPAGSGYGFNRPKTAGRMPYTEGWNFTVEQQLPAQIVATVTYAGSGSHFIGLGGDGSGIYSDQINPAYMALGSLLGQPATPANIAAANAITPGIALPYANFDTTQSIAQMLRPFPQYNGTGSLFAGPDPEATLGTSHYESFQASATRRMTKGLYFLLAYTFSHAVDLGVPDSVGFENQAGRTAYNWGQELSVSSTDTPQVWSLVYVYHLPFGRGQAIGGNVGNLANEIVGGWTFSGLQQYSAGTPLGPMTATCNVPTETNCYADFNPSFTGSARLNGSYKSKPTLPHINVNAFENPASYTFGNTPRTFGSLRTPWALDESFNLQKDFRITERLTFRFRADAFNMFNRQQFGGINTNINSTSFGVASGQVNTPREGQFEGYLRF